MINQNITKLEKFILLQQNLEYFFPNCVITNIAKKIHSYYETMLYT
jgi:hypothetical protein